MELTALILLDGVALITLNLMMIPYPSLLKKLNGAHGKDHMAMSLVFQSRLEKVIRKSLVRITQLLCMLGSKKKYASMQLK